MRKYTVWTEGGPRVILGDSYRLRYGAITIYKTEAIFFGLIRGRYTVAIFPCGHWSRVEAEDVK